MFLRPNSSFATEYIYMTTSFRNILPQVKFYTHLEWTSDIVRGEVCSEGELSDHTGKWLALIFILALSIHLQYFIYSAVPQSLARTYKWMKSLIGGEVAFFRLPSQLDQILAGQWDPVTHVFVRLWIK